VTHHNPASDATCEFIVLAVQNFVRGEALRHVYRQHAGRRVLWSGGHSSALAQGARSCGAQSLSGAGAVAGGLFILKKAVGHSNQPQLSTN